MGIRHYDLNVPLLRVLGLFSHFILTTFLIWTKIDSIEVTLGFGSNTNELYRKYNANYQTMISFGLILNIFRIVMLSIDPGKVSIVSFFNLFCDGIACLFISWIVLDGLPWHQYTYILVFCV